MGRHTKAMLDLREGLGVAMGVGALVGNAEWTGVDDGAGVAHPATRTPSTTAASVFIVD
jgi:hypothetical protein